MVSGILSKAFYGPPEWLVTKFSAKDRRAFGFWNIVVAAALAPFLGNKVWYVTILSVIALIPNFAAETPKEKEEE